MKMLYNFIPTVNRKVFGGEAQSFQTQLKSPGTYSFPVQQLAVPWHNTTVAEAHRSLGAGIRKAQEASLSKLLGYKHTKKKPKTQKNLGDCSQTGCAHWPEKAQVLWKSLQQHFHYQHCCHLFSQP